MKIHKPNCASNISCLVYHGEDGCPGYKDCDCQRPEPGEEVEWTGYGWVKRQPEVEKKELCPKGCFQCDSPKGVITSWSFPCEKGGHCHHNSCDVRHEKPCDEPNCVQSKYRHRKDLSDLELREMKCTPQPSKCEHDYRELTLYNAKNSDGYVLAQCVKCAENEWIKPSSELEGTYEVSIKKK